MKEDKSNIKSSRDVLIFAQRKIWQKGKSTGHLEKSIYMKAKNIVKKFDFTERMECLAINPDFNF